MDAEQFITANLAKARRVTLHGQEWFVAPMTSIVHGVLNGSKGALYYPPNEISKDHTQWDNIPLVVYHPTENGLNVSASHPGVLERSGIGLIKKSRFNTTNHGKEKLQHEAWFDAERTKAIEPRVYEALVNGRPIEVSTGLYTDNEEAPAGSVYNGKPYTHIARNYRPDHMAILPDQQGACSVNDGCGVLVNKEAPVVNELSEWMTSNGGKGSGNFGHEGRPGKQGGSAAHGERAASVLAHREEVKKQHHAFKLAAFNAVKADAERASDKANEIVEKEIHGEGISNLAAVHDEWERGHTTTFNELEALVNSYNENSDASTIERHQWLKDIEEKAQEFKALNKTWKEDNPIEDFEDPQDALDDEGLKENAKRINHIIKQSRVARQHLKEHALHRKEMRAIRAGELVDNQEAEPDEQLDAVINSVEEHEMAVNMDTDLLTNAELGANKRFATDEDRKAAFEQMATVNGGPGSGNFGHGGRPGKRGGSTQGRSVIGIRDEETESPSSTLPSHSEDIDAEGKRLSDYAIGRTAAAKKAGGKERRAKEHAKAETAHLAAAEHHQKHGNDQLAAHHLNAAMEHSGMADDLAANTVLEIPTMNRNEMISYLVTNCKCSGFDKDDEETLNGLEEEKLKTLTSNTRLVLNTQTVTNEKACPECGAAMEDGKCSKCGYTAKSKPSMPPATNTNQPVPTPTEKPMTLNEWMASAPPEIQSAVANAMEIEKREKLGLIQQLTANVSDLKQKEAHFEYLKGKSLPELRQELERHPPTRNAQQPLLSHANTFDLSFADLQQQQTFNQQNLNVAGLPVQQLPPNYAGAAGGAPGLTGNAAGYDDTADILEMPTINWAEDRPWLQPSKAKQA